MSLFGGKKTPKDDDTPDFFEPSDSHKEKQGQSSSRRIAMIIFAGAAVVFVLVAFSILNSDSGMGSSKAPTNLFEASKGAESISLPKPKPPEPEPIPEPEPSFAPPPVRPVRIPIPSVSTRRRQTQVKRLLSASSTTAIPIFLAEGNNANGGRNTRSEEEASAISEVSRMLANTPASQGSDYSIMPPNSGGGDADPNGWARKDSFSRDASLLSGYSQHSLIPPRSRLELKAGALLPCVLISGLNSDLPGNMTAQISENVWDTATGKLLLIPRGSRLIGTYDNQISYGQSRVLVIWSRIIFPDGSSLILDNLKGADQSGYSGFKGAVNRHWGSIISSALMVSILGAGVDVILPKDDDEDNPKSALARNAAASIAEAISQIIRREVSRQPTIKVAPGFRFTVFIQNDIIFPSAWRQSHQ